MIQDITAGLLISTLIFSLQFLINYFVHFLFLIQIKAATTDALPQTEKERVNLAKKININNPIFIK